MKNRKLDQNEIITRERLQFLESLLAHYKELKEILLKIKVINENGGIGSRERINNLIDKIRFYI